MKAIILAGGFGTRLAEETEAIPKPMIEIGGRPLLWHLMNVLSATGANDFVVALGYKGEVIKRYFLQYPQLGSELLVDLVAGTVERKDPLKEQWRINLVDTGESTMTGGRLKRLAAHVDSTFIFTYGDGLSDIDVRSLVDFHKSHGKLATVTAVRAPSRFGILQMDGTNVSAFEEKPVEVKERINGGFFVLEPEVLDYIDGDETFWEREPCSHLAKDGQLEAYVHDGYWQCVDTLHELRLLRDAWDNGAAPWKVWK